ncbi:unnamed protein product [Urochloa humidicola]
MYIVGYFLIFLVFFSWPFFDGKSGDVVGDGWARFLQRISGGGGGTFYTISDDVRWSIKFLHHFSDEGIGEEAVRSVCFCHAKGRKLVFPAMGSRSGLSTTSAAADSFSDRWSGGRRWRICSSPTLVVGLLVAPNFMLLCSSGGDGRCALEAVYSAMSPRSKSSYAVSTMWTLSGQHMTVTGSTPATCNGRISRRRREDPGSGFCSLQIFQELLCNRAGMYCFYLD